MTTLYDYIPKSKFNNVGITWFNDSQSTKGEVQTMQTINLGNDVEQLIDKIEELTWGNGIMDWHIVEDFDNLEMTEYYLQGLKMELEEKAGVVVSTDANYELLEDMSRTLNMFAARLVLKIELHDKNIIKIYFKDGSITIKGISTR